MKGAIGVLTQARNTSQDGHIMLSSYRKRTLHAGNSKGFLRSDRAKWKKGKNVTKRQPGRGPGVAQLEMIRLEEEYRKQEAAAVHVALLHGRVAQAVVYQRPPMSVYENKKPLSSAVLSSTDNSTPIKEFGLFSSNYRHLYHPFHCRTMHDANALIGVGDDYSIPFSLQHSSGLNVHLTNELSKLNATESRQQQPLSILQPFNAWGTESLSCTSNRNTTQKKPSCREDVDVREDLGVKLPTLEKQIQLVPMTGRKMELSSFQNMFLDYSGCSMKNEMNHFERRSCAIVGEQSSNIQPFTSLNLLSKGSQVDRGANDNVHSSGKVGTSSANSCHTTLKTMKQIWGRKELGPQLNSCVVSPEILGQPKKQQCTAVKNCDLSLDQSKTRSTIPACINYTTIVDRKDSDIRQNSTFHDFLQVDLSRTLQSVSETQTRRLLASDFTSSLVTKTDRSYYPSHTGSVSTDNNMQVNFIDLNGAPPIDNQIPQPNIPAKLNGESPLSALETTGNQIRMASCSPILNAGESIDLTLKLQI